MALVIVFSAAYELLRTDMVQDGVAAAQHALAIVNLESAVGLFREQALQQVFLRAPDLVKVCNFYYGATHFVVPAAALIWLAVRHPDRYARARTTLGITTGVAFVVFWLYPVAPPRLLPPRFGIIDTLVTFQQSGHLEHTLVDSAGDVYAATPSLHVAWALWCALVLYPVVRHLALKVVLMAYPVATTVVVIVTGNHFVFDAACGALLVVGVWTLTPRCTRWAVALVRPALARPHPVTDGRPEGVTAPTLLATPPTGAARPDRSRPTGGRRCHRRPTRPGGGRSDPSGSPGIPVVADGTVGADRRSPGADPPGTRVPTGARRQQGQSVVRRR
jgi:hypothetical protein